MIGWAQPAEVPVRPSAIRSHRERICCIWFRDHRLLLRPPGGGPQGDRGGRGWEAGGELCTSWPEDDFDGARFRVEAVYQRTVQELRSRGSLIWLVFTPLARDATAEALGEVIDFLRREVVDPRDRVELFLAMLVMADINPWGHNLRKELEKMLEENELGLIMASETLRAAFEQGQKEGHREGHQEGHREGLSEGVERILRRQFVHRLGRKLTDEEQMLLAKRTREQGAEGAEVAVLELEGEALLDWLRDPSPEDSH